MPLSLFVHRADVGEDKRTTGKRGKNALDVENYVEKLVGHQGLAADVTVSNNLCVFRATFNNLQFAWFALRAEWASPYASRFSHQAGV